jgi:hypothetical protein
LAQSSCNSLTVQNHRHVYINHSGYKHHRNLLTSHAHNTYITLYMIHHSTDTLMYLPLPQISSQLLFFPLHTPNSGHNYLLLHRQVELKLQGINFTHPGNAQRTQTYFVEWKQFTGKGKPNVVRKQLSGNEGQNMEGFCGSGTCLKHV